MFYCEVSVLFYSLTGFRKGISMGICTESLSVMIMWSGSIVFTKPKYNPNLKETK